MPYLLQNQYSEKLQQLNLQEDEVLSDEDEYLSEDSTPPTPNAAKCAESEEYQESTNSAAKAIRNGNIIVNGQSPTKKSSNHIKKALITLMLNKIRLNNEKIIKLFKKY